MKPYWSDGTVTLHLGDCLDVLAAMEPASVDAVVTDPPYGLEFMGKEWDSFRHSNAGPQPMDFKGFGDMPSFSPNRRNQKCPSCGKWAYDHPGRKCECGGWKQPAQRGYAVAFQAWCQQWAAECLRVLKPGGHLLAFGGTRTWHRLACGIEDAGFEIRDSLADLTGREGPGLLWMYGSGFPKSLDVSKAIDKAAGAERLPTGQVRRGVGLPSGTNLVGGQIAESDKWYAATAPATEDAARWEGWGTALKPAWEPIVVARKPLAGTVAANVTGHGTGALNVDGCRVGTSGAETHSTYGKHPSGIYNDYGHVPAVKHEYGRWPPNVMLGPDAAAELDRQSGASVSRAGQPRKSAAPGDGYGMTHTGAEYGDQGGASRFFPVFRYEAKAPGSERPRGEDGTAHPTVKPVDLMAWLVRLVTPPGGLVLDPFAGSGTTAEACIIEGFRCVLIEKDPAYAALIRKRLSKDIQPAMFGSP